MKPKSLAILFLVLVSLPSCSSPPLPQTMVPLEQTLGDGWTCYMVPDSFKMAGVVIEATSNGDHFHFLDFSHLSKTGRSAIGSLRYQSDIGLHAFASLFSGLFALDGEPLLSTASDERKLDVSISYGDTRKLVLDADGLQHVVNEMAKRPIDPTSTYFVFRESYAAKAMSVFVNSKRLQSLGIDVDESARSSPELHVRRHRGEEYALDKEFDEHLGICTIAAQLVVSSGFLGTTTITLGSDTLLPADITVQRK